MSSCRLACTCSVYLTSDINTYGITLNEAETRWMVGYNGPAATLTCICWYTSSGWERICAHSRWVGWHALYDVAGVIRAVLRWEIHELCQMYGKCSSSTGLGLDYIEHVFLCFEVEDTLEDKFNHNE